MSSRAPRVFPWEAFFARHPRFAIQFFGIALLLFVLADAGLVYLCYWLFGHHATNIAVIAITGGAMAPLLAAPVLLVAPAFIFGWDKEFPKWLDGTIHVLIVVMMVGFLTLFTASCIELVW